MGEDSCETWWALLLLVAGVQTQSIYVLPACQCVCAWIFVWLVCTSVWMSVCVCLSFYRNERLWCAPRWLIRLRAWQFADSESRKREVKTEGGVVGKKMNDGPEEKG